MIDNDRREFQRLRLAKPILGTMDGGSVLILDVGVGGAFIEHYGPTEPGRRFHLSFRWHGDDVTFLCEVARTTVVRSVAGDGRSVLSHTGVRFLEGIGEASGRLQDMMATFVGRVLAGQRANARGTRSAESISLAEIGGARRSRARGYATYRFDGETWTREITTSPVQPPDGFTVAAFEDEEELQTLCLAYETADEQGRNLIRLVAELSAMSGKR
jgi:hypothetical protein